MRNDPTLRPAARADLTGRARLRVRLQRHVPELLRLAWPVIIARLGITTFQLADTIMVGRFGSRDLAYLAIANSPVQAVLIGTLGLLVGTTIVSAHAIGANTPQAAGHAWRRSLPYGLWLGVAAAALCLLGTPFLRLVDQPPDLVDGGGPLIAVLGLGVPAYLIFITSSFFLEGIKRPQAAMLVMVLGNLVNVAANWVLIYGHLGFPALGAEGSAWATTLVRVVMAVAIVAYIWWLLPDRDRYAVRARPPGGWRDWAYQRRLGYASGLSLGAEAGSFAIVLLMAGWLGGLALAGYGITLNVVATAFMVSLGFSSATGVRVGTAYGRRDSADLALAGWTGLAVNTLVMGVIAAVVLLFNDGIAAIYSQDAALIALTAPLIAFAASIVVADGGQSVIMHALRGRGETWVPTVLHFICYFAIQIPICYLLAFPLGRGVPGLLEGILIGALCATVALGLRFWWLGRRDRNGLVSGRIAG